MIDHRSYTRNLSLVGCTSILYWLVFYLLYCGAKSLSDNMHWNDEYTLYITESLSSLYPGITFHLISSEL